MSSITLKFCKICLESKAKDSFSKNAGRVCKKCYYKTYIRPKFPERKSYTERDSNAIKEERRARSSERRIEARLWVYEYLKRNPCARCGESNPIKLEFHHIGPKRFAIAAYLSSGRSGLFKDGKLVGIDTIAANDDPIQVVMDEIAQCEVICRNCHAWTTAKERNTFRYRQWSLDNGGTGS